MNIRHHVLGSALALASACAWSATVVYEGVLVPSVPATGQVGGFGWFLDNGSLVDYWRFAGVAGQTVSFSVDRLNGNLDPALSFYRGITSADTSLFASGASWGGLTFLGSTGDYTVVVGGANSTDAGAYPYRLTMTATAAPIPEPSVWAMFGLGLAALGVLRRRKKA